VDLQIIYDKRENEIEALYRKIRESEEARILVLQKLAEVEAKGADRSEFDLEIREWERRCQEWEAKYHHMSREHDHHEHEMMIIKEKLLVSDESLNVIRFEFDRAQNDAKHWEDEYNKLRLDYEQLKNQKMIDGAKDRVEDARYEREIKELKEENSDLKRELLLMREKYELQVTEYKNIEINIHKYKG
jgi:chromosome segregation ATPase